MLPWRNGTGRPRTTVSSFPQSHRHRFDIISTDLAARGLDIPEVKHVIHYHLPLNEEAFVHRNGRTARMHAEGTAYLLLNEAEAVPEYVSPEPDEFFLPEKARRPKASEWTTLTIHRGKRDKLRTNKRLTF